MSRPVAGLIPAAGRSSRMGTDKLTTAVAGRAMLTRVAEALIAGGCTPVLVVCRGADDARSAAVGHLPVTLVEAARPEDGMGASIAAGVAVLPDEAAGVAVCPGDMPLLTGADVQRLLAAFDGTTVTAAVCDGRRGHPVIFPARLFHRLAALTGDQGARPVLADEPVTPVETGRGCLVDVDTPEDLAALAHLPPSAATE